MTKEVFPEREEAFAAAKLGLIRHSSLGESPLRRAFTLIELVLVVGIIIVLSGLVLSTVGYARKKGARARAEIEIAAMSAAMRKLQGR